MSDAEVGAGAAVPAPRPVVAATYVHDLRTDEAGRGGTVGAGTWTPVRRAVPYFADHRQPKVPARFGYYDPGDVEVQAAHFSLATRYGITDFCYEYRGPPPSGAGPQLVDRLADRGDLEVRFFLKCSLEAAVDGPGVGRHSEEGGPALERLATILTDGRYTTLGGRPVLLLEAGSPLGGLRRMADELRRSCNRLGVGDPFVALADPPKAMTALPPEFDAMVESQADFDDLTVGINPTDPAAPELYDPDHWQGGFASYARVMSRALARPAPGYPWLRSGLPGFDDSPTRSSASTVLLGENPELFGTWMRRLLEHTYLFNSQEHWMVFAGPWNAWGVGAYLEPDLDHDDARLAGLREALGATDRLRLDVHAAGGHGQTALLDTTRAYVEGMASIALELLATWRRPTRTS